MYKVLGAITWWESIGVDTPNIVGVAYLAGYSPTSSGFEKTRSQLRTAGLIEYPSGGTVRLTHEGRMVAPTAPAGRLSNADLHEAVLGKLEPRFGRLLRPLIDAWPEALTMEKLSEVSGYSDTSSGFEKARSTLRSLGLIDYPRPGHARAEDLLFPEEQ
jgi:hypothetical protein